MLHTDLTNNITGSQSDFTLQHWISIFRNPHYVILDVVNRMCPRAIVTHLGTSLGANLPQGEGFYSEYGTMNNRPYQMCVRCIMDTTDPDIRFDENGFCNHCRNYEELAKRQLRLDAEGQEELVHLVDEIRTQGKEYDCVIGVSGGVDSTFATYTVKKLGLRPLAVHLDNGWDSELAVSNIEKFLKRLDIDLYTHVLDWEEFKDLQIAFLKASVSDAEIPTDHAIFAVMYRSAIENGVSYIISGSNTVTEGILPSSWTYGVGDWRYIKSVHHEFGKTKLKSYPHYSLFDLLCYSFLRRIEVIHILDYIPYIREDAKRILEKELGWRDYGGKHYESVYTRFFQGYILPRKFDIDKRKAHLSTLICSGQITRAEALEEIESVPYPEDMQREDKEYVIKKLGLTEEEFERIMSLPIETYLNYPTYAPFVKLAKNSRIGQIAKKSGLLPRSASFHI